MRPGVLQYLAAWIQLLPALVTLGVGRQLTPARRWVLIWCLLLVGQDALSLMLGVTGRNNLWVNYAFAPLTSSVALWALAYWQPHPTPRAALRLAMPVVVVISLLLTLRFEDRTSFSLFVGPFHGLVLLLATIWTFIQRATIEDERFLRSDWFWVIGGLMLYFGASATQQPISWYFLRDRVDLLHSALTLKAATDVLAFLAITGGMLCPTGPSSSGGLSRSPSSPSSRSSSDSPPHW